MSQKEYLLGSEAWLWAHKAVLYSKCDTISWYPPRAKSCTKGKYYNKTRHLWKNTEAECRNTQALCIGLDLYGLVSFLF